MCGSFPCTSTPLFSKSILVDKKDFRFDNVCCTGKNQISVHADTCACQMGARDAVQVQWAVNGGHVCSMHNEGSDTTLS